MTLGRISGAVQRAPHAVIAWLGAVPTTNTRILATLGMAYITTLRYVTSETWTPSVEWLAFLVALSGVDAIQFYGKRRTHTVPENGEPPA